MILFFVSFAAVLPRGSVTGFFCLLAHAMPPGKRKLDDAAEEWRQELADGFVSGCVSGLRLQRMAAKASRAGAEGGDGIAKAGKSGKLPQNVFRDVNRCLKKSSLWPKYYWAKIPVWDTKQEALVWKDHCFFLPHEWLAKLRKMSNLGGLVADPTRHTDIYRHVSKVAAGLGSPPEDYIALGLHCDGVPFGSQVFYSDSLEVFSINFPCGEKNMRIPFTSVQKNHLVKHETFNAILEVLAWSLKHLALGTFPSQRHDGTEFGPGEKHRQSVGQHCEPAQALLVEIRADWMALKQVFQFPQQNEKAGICWMCYATPGNYKDCKSSAEWRRRRRTAVQWHLELARVGKNCPLWSVPGVSSEVVVVDWLHCADLGVTADVCGNVMLELVDASTTAGDRKVKMKALWSEIQAEYDTQGVSKDQRFPVLRVNHFLTAKKSPKLKGKAAHVRYFVPVLNSLVQRLVQGQDHHNNAVRNCMENLAVCYSCLAPGAFDAAKLATASTRMGTLYCALEKEQFRAGVLKRWKVKPKLHLFMELCHYLCLERQRGNPRNFWTYGDESHGALMRESAVARGGRNTSSSSAYRMLNMFVNRHDMLTVMD